VFGSWKTCFIYRCLHCSMGTRGGAVGTLRAGRSRVRFPMIELEFFVDIILPAMSLGSTQPLTEIIIRNIRWGLKVAGA
jgi:hypothetical protein